ncbi:MAG: sulfotransferase domain-containing protein [Cyclobacteriaceae bacterium]|nr:sulfotransferase domain-containing protein [Cyclobacteriaceae bacterium]
MANPEIYFHVGLGKTASTYLQMDVFPKFNNIHYIHTNKYKKAKEIIAEGKYDHYLVSREFDRQLEDEVRKFSSKYPDTHPIIILRRHDGWMASQYRRQVKNGNTYSFTEYFDVINNKGIWDRSEADFHNKLMILEKYFTKKPLVLFYEDLRTDQLMVIDKIAQFTKITYNKSNISTSKNHSSYSEKQLKGIKRVAKIIPLKKSYKSKIKVINFFHNLGVSVLRYPLLYFFKLMPNRFFTKEPLIDKKQLEEVRDYFASDWDKVKQYAEKNNPPL